MVTIPQKQIKQFQNHILNWYQKNKRDLPWRPPSLKLRRDGKPDPYHILVSEIMSQQTQIARVIPKYEAWIKKFPDVESLAKAKTSEILQYWSGLGYNRRALYLQKCAKTIVEQYRGKFPKDIDELKELPGIGEYTAAAVSCFAFDQQIAVVDTNVRKVILTQFVNRHSGVATTTIESQKDPIASLQDDRSSIKEIRQIADQLLPVGKASEWNQALMDYAASMLKKEKIPVPKQSKFKDSDRYYRGQIIRLLLSDRYLSLKTLHHRFSLEKKRLEAIVAGLIRDGLVIQEKKTLHIKEDAFV